MLNSFHIRFTVGGAMDEMKNETNPATAKGRNLSYAPA
jgi:hypothetical protein